MALGLAAPLAVEPLTTNVSVNAALGAGTLPCVDVFVLPWNVVVDVPASELAGTKTPT